MEKWKKNHPRALSSVCFTDLYKRKSCLCVVCKLEWHKVCWRGSNLSGEESPRYHSLFCSFSEAVQVLLERQSGWCKCVDTRVDSRGGTSAVSVILDLKCTVPSLEEQSADEIREPVTDELIIPWAKGRVCAWDSSLLPSTFSFMCSQINWFWCWCPLTITEPDGPDTPVLTKQSPNQNANACVGGGDVVVGQTVGFTCTSTSLPPAMYSWQYNGQPVTSSQSASGLLTLQTYSTNQSGQYFCTATNTISGNTSTQGTVLAVVGELWGHWPLCDW